CSTASPTKMRTGSAIEAAPCISFTNGITRTIWLLAARAERFPVSCSTDDATLLHQLVGADDTEPHLVVDLVPRIDHLAKLNENEAFCRKLEAHGLPVWLG
ncbi:plasmid fertility inhibition factor family protein, partial [Burkholderia cenocepacia]